MKDKILVVEKNRNGEIVKQYYITKKEAQKHMSQRHKRLDRYRQRGGKKKTRARTYKKNRTRKFH
jgi:hypothetical protein